MSRCSLRLLLVVLPLSTHSLLFFFNDTATTEIYTLSLHDALPIYSDPTMANRISLGMCTALVALSLVPLTGWDERQRDRKSTRLNSSHVSISYAVFCLKKKKNTTNELISKHT